MLAHFVVKVDLLADLAAGVITDNEFHYLFECSYFEVDEIDVYLQIIEIILKCTISLAQNTSWC